MYHHAGFVVCQGLFCAWQAYILSTELYLQLYYMIIFVALFKHL